MAISIRKQYDRAAKRKAAAVEAIYRAAMPRTDVKFWDCYAMASSDVQHAYNVAVSECERICQEAIDKGCAYPGAYGLLCWN